MLHIISVKDSNSAEYFYRSQNDWLAQPVDVQRYLESLESSFAVYEVPYAGKSKSINETAK